MENQNGRSRRKHAAKPVRSSLALELLYLLLKMSLIAALVFALFTFVYGAARVQDLSMSPAIADGDMAIYYRLDRLFNKGDVAMIQYRGQSYPLRVAAVEGDVVDIDDGGLMVNGAYQAEPGIYFDTTRFAEGVDFPVTVGAGQIFLLGDNRTGATDSRIFGCVDIDDIQGKVIGIIRTRTI